MNWLSEAIAWFGDAENYRGSLAVQTVLVDHLGLTAASLGIACLIGLPLAIWLGHVGRGGVLAIQVSNVGRAVPTLAVLVILVLMSAPFGRTTLSALTAFTLFALPPIITNAYIGMREVDRNAVDAGRGMGMSGWQVLTKIELPMAVPLLMNGVRLAAVQLVATVSIAALAAFGGLGRIVTRGYSNRDVGELVAGALMIALLALLFELFFAWFGAVADPARRARKSAVRRQRSASPRQSSGV